MHSSAVELTREMISRVGQRPLSIVKNKLVDNSLLKFIQSYID
jgi:hypothetical protein